MTRTPSVLRTTLAAFAVAAVSAVLGATAAQAYNTPGYWNASSSPLQVSGYGSTASAYGYAKVFNGSSGTAIYNYGYHKFTDGDDHRPYLGGSSQWNAGSCGLEGVTVGYKGVQVGASASCASVFYDGNNLPRQDGSTSTVTAWTAFPTVSAKPPSGSDRGRVEVKLCLDIPWRLDVCVGYSYSPADSY